jgi:flagellar operon protein (TIGR03826 family)
VTREVRNCKRCGKVFVYAGIPVCPECLEKEEEQYRKVKRFLDDHPRAGVSETSEETGVPVEVVVEFLRQGLLVTQAGPAGQLTCMMCKKPITRGKLCPRCEALLGATAAKLREPEPEGTAKELPKGSTTERMYVMELIGRKKR